MPGWGFESNTASQRPCVLTIRSRRIPNVEIAGQTKEEFASEERHISTRVRSGDRSVEVSGVGKVCRSGQDWERYVEVGRSGKGM